MQCPQERDTLQITIKRSRRAEPSEFSRHEHSIGKFLPGMFVSAFVRQRKMEVILISIQERRIFNGTSKKSRR